MSYTPIAVENFSGLTLIDDPGELAWSRAVDLLNVDLDQRGRVRSRDGFAKFTSAAAVAAYHSLAPYYKTDGTRQLIAAFGGASGAINALNTSGAVVAAQSYANSAYVSVARFAAPGSEYAYVAGSQATGAATVYRWDGAAWTTPTWSGTTPTGRHIAAWQNRLVNSRRAGTTNGDSVSTVRFSNITTGPPPAADPQTWNANDFVELSPGDGEEITGLITWRDSCFAFKESKFFVFYGTSTDSSSGNPVFNYRPVYGQGLASAGGQSSYRAVAAAPDGVYFLNRRGVWFTTGGPPELVSGAIEPIFRGQTNAFYQGGVLNQAAINTVAMAWHDNRLYIAFPSGSSTTNDKILIYDPQSGYWLLWNIPSSSLTTFRISNVDELALAIAGGSITLGAPGSPSAAQASTAGTLTGEQTYYYKVTALNAAGETTPATEVSATARVAPGAINSPGCDTAPGGSLTVGQTYYYKFVAMNDVAAAGDGGAETFATPVSGFQSIAMGWSAGTGTITSYRVYRGLSAGAENQYRDVGNVTTFTDDGSGSWTSGSVPSATSYRSVTVTWAAVSGATGYRVYRGTTSGGENVFFAPGNVLTFTDTGGAGTGGSPPVSNTATTASFDVGRYNITSGYIVDGGDGLTTGAGITSRYRSGFYTVPPGNRADGKRVIRQWHLRGSGTVTFGVAADDATSIPTTGGGAQASVTLTAARPNYRTSQIGRNFSWQASSTSGAWRLDAVQADLA